MHVQQPHSPTKEKSLQQAQSSEIVTRRKEKECHTHKKKDGMAVVITDWAQSRLTLLSKHEPQFQPCFLRAEGDMEGNANLQDPARRAKFRHFLADPRLLQLLTAQLLL